MRETEKWAEFALVIALAVSLVFLMRSCTEIAEAEAAVVGWTWTVSLYEADSSDPDTACVMNSPSSDPEDVTECEIAIWRFSYGDTTFHRLSCNEGQIVMHDVNVAPGTMAQASVRSKDAAGNWGCWGNWVTFVVPYSEAPPVVAGIQGEYFDNQDFTGTKVTRLDAKIDFPDWGSVQPVPGMANTTFSVRWTGYITPSVTGNFQLHAQVNDGVRLWVDGTQIINSWTNNGYSERTATVALQAGTNHPITLEYFQELGGAQCTLAWTPPGQAKAVVPASAFSH